MRCIGAQIDMTKMGVCFRGCADVLAIWCCFECVCVLSKPHFLFCKSAEYYVLVLYVVFRY